MTMTPKYDKDALLALHAQGLSLRQISRQTGISRSTIDRYVHDAGQGRPRAKSLTKVGDDGQTLKWCSECKIYKPANEKNFVPHKRGYAGFYSTCRDCKHAKDAARFARVKEADALRGKLWRAELRREVISYYSAGTYSCSCCGESHIEFLVIDHIDGAGNNHRRSINRSGLGFYRWLRANGYPSVFRVLCHNCNAAFGLYGTCPHQAEKSDTAEMAWVPTGRAGRAQEAAPF
jgi:transcriptional regulator with XRE-family HTH domain